MNFLELGNFEIELQDSYCSIFFKSNISVNQLGTKREIVGLSTAVTPYNAELISNECVRITIGGVVPDGADTVVPIENVALLKEEKCIEVLRKPKEGDNIRQAVHISNSIL